MEPLNRSWIEAAASTCGHYAPLASRRTFLKLAGLGGASWLTPLAHSLAARAETARGGEPAQSVILLWLAGGPSQLETFDPHAGTDIAAGTKSIPTAAAGVELAEGLPRVAEQMQSISLIRSMKSKEGDHERGAYVAKTGYGPDPTVVHPSIGAICANMLPPRSSLAAAATEIPRHISILPDQWPGRGGYLGAEYDAFKTFDPRDPAPDVARRVSVERDERRFADDLSVVEQAFARGRSAQAQSTLHRHTMDAARRMMSSEQLAAFDVMQEPASLREEYGDSAFGRGCLAARRLVEVGARCVEVTLGGWDSHVANHEIHRGKLAVLDPAFAALVRDLRERELLDRTIVICAGEFGRTPRVNRLGGRDHWPHGFSIALAGGGIVGGRVIGETDPEGGKELANPKSYADVYATVLTALGVDPTEEKISPVGRPLKLAEGEPIDELLGGDA